MKLLRKIITFLSVLAMIGVGILFALQNKAPVPLDLLLFTFEPKSLALWVLSAFALGGVGGMVVSSLILVRMRAALGSSKRQLARVQTDMNKLKTAEAAGDAS